MSNQMIRILLAGALFIHGIGHTLGFWMPTRSWLFPNLPESVARWISSIFWILSALGFVVATLGFLDLFVPAHLWRAFAIGTAIISLIGLALFGNNWALLNSGGALLMNLAILISLLWLHWLPQNTF